MVTAFVSESMTSNSASPNPVPIKIVWCPESMVVGPVIDIIATCCVMSACLGIKCAPFNFLL